MNILLKRHNLSKREKNNQEWRKEQTKVKAIMSESKAKKKYRNKNNNYDI